MAGVVPPSSGKQRVCRSFKKFQGSAFVESAANVGSVHHAERRLFRTILGKMIPRETVVVVTVVVMGVVVVDVVVVVLRYLLLLVLLPLSLVSSLWSSSLMLLSVF